MSRTVMRESGLLETAALVREVFDELPYIVVASDGPQHHVVAVNAAYRALWPPGATDCDAGWRDALP